MRVVTALAFLPIILFLSCGPGKFRVVPAVDGGLGATLEYRVDG